MKILFVIAMEKEAKRIIEKLGLDKVENNDLDIYIKHNMSLLITGIGKQKVAINLTRYLEKVEKPDLIINVGYAGSTNAKIGDWVQINQSFNYEWNIPGEEKYTMPEYNRIDIFKDIANVDKINCYTAESFVTKTNIEENVAFDMELHSIYLLCCMYNIKLISLKKISDSLSLDDYYKNLAQKNIFELESCIELLSDSLKLSENINK